MIANRDLIPDPPQAPGVTSEKLIPSPLRAASPLRAEGISASTGFSAPGSNAKPRRPRPLPAATAAAPGGRRAAAAAAPPRRSRRPRPLAAFSPARRRRSPRGISRPGRDGPGGVLGRRSTRGGESRGERSGQRRIPALQPGERRRGGSSSSPAKRRTGEEQNLLLQRQEAAASASPAGRDIPPPARPCPAQPSPAEGRGHRRGTEGEGERRGARPPPPSRASPAPPALPEPAGAPGSRSPISSSLCRGRLCWLQTHQRQGSAARPACCTCPAERREEPEPLRASKGQSMKASY
ncbi:histamine H1 receptor isoform X3 [Buteo buteo]|uniref:histamine H1 receptor isoform X3 n=1 Tax=Buteo buteo TaxID=30397 RepID=UPI003EC0F606